MNPAKLMQSPPGRFFAKIQEDNALNWAIIIAWNTLTNLFPLVLVSAAVLGLLLGVLGVNSKGIYGALLTVIPNDNQARAEALNALNTFQQRSGLFFVVGFAGLMWTATGLFRSMEQAFAVIYHTKQRSLLRGILMSFGMMVLFIALVGVMVVSSTFLGYAQHLSFLPTMIVSNGIVALGTQFVIGILSGFLLFLAIYYVVPNQDQKWRKVVPGALFSGLLFEGLSLLFPVYIRYTGGGTAYGKTFGLIFLLMTFFYFLGIVTMLGVELNSLLYPIPVDQPDGRESLRTPIQAGHKVKPAVHSGREAKPPSHPETSATTPRTKSSRVKGLLALGILTAAGVVRRPGRRDIS